MSRANELSEALRECRKRVVDQDELRAQLRGARNSRANMQEGLEKARAERDQLKIENRRLRNALCWYADRYNYRRRALPPDGDEGSSVEKDDGIRARTALAYTSPGKG
jgi:chromosome segregation ATPase